MFDLYLKVSNIFANMTVRENVRCGVLYSMGYGYSFWRNIVLSGRLVGGLSFV